MLRVGLAIFLSGAASLMYQVTWTRRLVTVTSATATAQALVLAVFMAGLGIGAALAGGHAPRARRPILAYAAVELIALIAALISLPVIDGSDALRALFERAGMSPRAALWSELAALSAFLLIPTALLGASLPYVLEHVERVRADDSSAARAHSTSWLYGVNTIGACLGAIASGFITIEVVGLKTTLAIGTGLAFGAVLLAASSSRDARARAPSPAAPEARTRPQAALVIAAALGGFTGLAAEVVWTRLFALYLINTVYAFTEVLAGVLAGVALGAMLSALVVRSTRGLDRAAQQPRMLELAAAFSALAAVLIALVPLIITELTRVRGFGVEIARGRSVLLSAIPGLVIIAPAALTAATLPLLVGAARVHHGSRALGTLYAANTFGSVAGSALAGFVLLPGAGLRLAGAIAAAIAGILSLLLYFAAGRRSGALKIAAPALLAAGLLSFSLDLPRDIYQRMIGDVRLLDFREGATSDVMVTEDATGIRRLWINSVWVAGTAARNQAGLGPPHRVLGHIPALFVDNPKRAVGIALGTGQTFAAILDHGVDRLDCVEINAEVLELTGRWFREVNEGLLENPRVRIHNDDGRAFLRATADRYDLIVLEPLQAWTAGTSNLYTKEFYEDAARVLQPGGVIGQWIPFYGQSPDDTRAMIRAALEVFPESSLWLDRNEGILIMSREPFRLSPELLGRRIRARGLQAELAENAYGDTSDVLSLFLAGPRGLRAWTQGAALLEDDHPFLEFHAARALSVAWGPAIQASVAEHLDAPLTYLEAGTSGAALERAGALRDTLIAARLAQGRAFEERAEIFEPALQKIPGSQLLATHYRELILEWAGDRATLAKGPSELETIFLRGIEHDPDTGEVMVNLAQLYLSTGRVEEAFQYLDRAAAIPRTRETALRVRARAATR